MVEAVLERVLANGSFANVLAFDYVHFPFVLVQGEPNRSRVAALLDGNNYCIREHDSGMDLFVFSGTEVLAPLNGVVHSFNSDGSGTTIVLRHSLDGQRFFTVYSQLSQDSADGLFVGRVFSRGDVIGCVGEFAGVVPHLHFHVFGNDFLSINPNLILQIPGVCLDTNLTQQINGRGDLI